MAELPTYHTCAECDRPMVAKRKHVSLPRGFAWAYALGLCGSCYKRAQRAGTLPDEPATGRTIHTERPCYKAADSGPCHYVGARDGLAVPTEPRPIGQRRPALSPFTGLPIQDRAPIKPGVYIEEDQSWREQSA